MPSIARSSDGDSVATLVVDPGSGFEGPRRPCTRRDLPALFGNPVAGVSAILAHPAHQQGGTLASFQCRRIGTRRRRMGPQRHAPLGGTMQLGSGARIVRSGARLALDDAKAKIFARALETNRPEPALTGHIVGAALAGNEVAWIVRGRRRRRAMGTAKHFPMCSRGFFGLRASGRASVQRFNRAITTASPKPRIVAASAGSAAGLWRLRRSMAVSAA